MPANFLDKAITERVLAAIEPEQIEIAIKAFEEVEQRAELFDKQWKMKIERADYEAQLAQRRYEEVDPSNRLVANTLENRWNETLTILEKLRTEHLEYQQKNMLAATQKEKNKLLALSQDLPRLWYASSTNVKDRKRIIRLLIKDITVEDLGIERKLMIHIRWQGGATESFSITRPQKVYDKLRHPPELVTRVRKLAETMTDLQITEIFNREKLKTNGGYTFTVKAISWIRSKHKIPSPCLQKPNELSINAVAEKFNVSHHVIRYWIKYGMIKARRIGPRLWININAKEENDLRKRVATSIKITNARKKSLNQIACAFSRRGPSNLAEEDHLFLPCGPPYRSVSDEDVRL